MNRGAVNLKEPSYSALRKPKREQCPYRRDLSFLEFGLPSSLAPRIAAFEPAIRVVFDLGSEKKVIGIHAGRVVATM
jgi:hypothetical protein